MPDVKNIISFPLAVKDEGGNIVSQRTVHVVVGEKDAPSVFQTFLLPLGGALIAASILIWLALKIKPGRKTDRILNRFEGFTAFFDGKPEDKN